MISSGTPATSRRSSQVLTEHLTPSTVARTKQRGASWEQIGAMLGMNKDTARKKWSMPARRPVQSTTPGPLNPAPTCWISGMSCSSRSRRVDFGRFLRA
ncbi:hypothetical protein ACIQCF_36295 [Streptomyces sp. NPDC088353]|uniref:hypothetical protein n=1 Tax=Streptomyces sp. NPDC088353 TaxID=3365855 RepID=UPI0037F300E6